MSKKEKKKKKKTESGKTENPFLKEMLQVEVSEIALRLVNKIQREIERIEKRFNVLITFDNLEYMDEGVVLGDINIKFTVPFRMATEEEIEEYYKDKRGEV